MIYSTSYQAQSCYIDIYKLSISSVSRSNSIVINLLMFTRYTLSRSDSIFIDIYVSPVFVLSGYRNGVYSSLPLS